MHSDQAAEFILREALAAGIRVGTNGQEVVRAAPMKLPYASRRTFETAIAEHKQEIIAAIMADNAERGRTRHGDVPS